MRNAPFAVDALERDLKALLDAWAALRRGQADMPFADDVKLTVLKRPASAMLLDVLNKPLRFRFAIVGDGVRTAYGSDLAGLFADEMTFRPPFHFLLSQCSATVEGRAPTYYADEAFGRLLLPLWGDGHVNMLLGAICPRGSAKGKARTTRTRKRPRKR